MDARGAPQRIGSGHVGDESGDLRIERESPRAVASRALSPPPTQPGAMPSDDGLGLDEDQCRPPPAPGGRQQDPKHAVTDAEVRPLHASLQGSQLVAEGKILEDHVVVATAGRGDRSQEQQCQFKHVVILSGVAAESNTGSVDDNILANESLRPCRRSHTGRRSCLFPLDCVEQAVEVVEIGRVAAYAGHVPAIQYTPAQHCCPCRLDCSIKNVFELGHYTGFLIRSF